MWGTQDLSAVLPEGASGLLAQLRAALSLTQNTRLLQLDTALPSGTLIPERCSVHEALHAEQPFLAELDCVSTHSGIPLTSLMGTGATLQLRLQDGGWRAWHGHVARAAHLGSDGGLTRYRLQLRDFTHWASLRRDTRIFQDQTAADIVQSVLMAHPQAQLRLDVSHPGPVRAITTQYRETDWAFAQRLMASEGWSWRIDHDPHNTDSPSGTTSLLTPSRHTLVVFDAQAPRPELGTLRFSRPGMRGATPDGFAQDTLTAWAPARQVGTNAITLGAWDERQLSGVSGSSALPDAQRPPGVPMLERYVGVGERQFADGRVADAQHGAPDLANARAQAWLDALLLAQQTVEGQGAVRALSVGATFTLAEHFTSGALDGSTFGSNAFSVIGITHEAANNLGVRTAPLASATKVEAGSYRNRFQAAPGHLRLVPAPLAAPPSPGLQTAVVMAQLSGGGVGSDAGRTAIHSDRDGRIRIQFPWQRGAPDDTPLAGGLAAPASPNGQTTGHAPGDARGGTWVRVLQDQAGPDWGAVFTPRPGTEVLVDFIDGDIDRPIVIGQLHNGPHTLPWPAGAGSQANHPGTLSGWHHPLLDEAGGQSGANQWLIDDSQGQLRMRLLSYSASHGHSELSLGHLVQHSARHDAQGSQARRGHWLGEGFYGHTEGWAVVRAGQGMLLSTSARAAQGSSVASTQMDASEAVAQLRASRQLGQALGDSARQQGALGLDSHGDGHGDNGPAWMAHTAAMAPAASGKLPATLNGQDARKAQAGSRTLADPVEAFARAQLHLDTPSSAALVSAEHLSMFSGQDTSLSTQGDAHLTAAHTLSAVSGQTTSLYTHAGGIHAIAANATLSLRAHTDAQQLWADQDITVQSTTDEVRVFAQDSITLTAGQSQITLQGGDITFTCPGSFTVKGASHEWGGGANASSSLLALPSGTHQIEAVSTPLERVYGQAVSVEEVPAEWLPNPISRQVKGYLQSQSVAEAPMSRGQVSSETMLLDRPADLQLWLLSSAAWHVSEDVLQPLEDSSVHQEDRGEDDNDQ
ncbi:type VI secretion system secreted protein VgrG [Aquabacterium commune]|uniref:Type VI secretion system secreted protein VgrG n=1 Tax=Aquabacterium commune TaxID=70586 RepID=A0A4R6R8F8_9BURK|nr:type VI secretion system Vgr family protein [Aquabacterium commune]TDP82065.1 type VI secretion system secreted protein VgrG [Aquabacterium commune]